MIYLDGVDVSHWQAQDPVAYDNPKQMDWQKAVDAGIKFAMIRCGSGIVPDWTYEYNRAECERLHIPFCVYHAFWPTTDVDRQVQFFIDHMAGDLYQMADIERDGGVPKLELSKRAKYYMEAIARARKSMIYTRASWWDYYIGETWGGQYPLHVAHYGAVTPDIPMGWNDWTFWQYSADGNLQGAKYGAQSRSVDINHYWGSAVDFEREFMTIIPVPEPEPIPCVPQFRVLVDVLNVRTGPGTTYPLASGDNKLAKGEVVSAVDIAGANVWVEIATGRWAAMKINATEYMELVE